MPVELSPITACSLHGGPLGGSVAKDYEEHRLFWNQTEVGLALALSLSKTA